MKRFAFPALMCLLVVTSALGSQWTSLIATEAAIVTLDKAEHPEPTPSLPDPTGTAIAGPLDTYRDARNLIDKGNALADRGKAILDAAERAGKITLDIHLPAPLATTLQPISSTGGGCASGVCYPVPRAVLVPRIPSVPAKPKQEPVASPVVSRPARGQCSGGYCPAPTGGTRMLRRWR